VKKSAPEVWIKMANGMMRGPRGELIPREKFEALRNDVGATVILPDNGRDTLLTEFGSVTSAASRDRALASAWEEAKKAPSTGLKKRLGAPAEGISEPVVST
jgi:hypothetical protein